MDKVAICIVSCDPLHKGHIEFFNSVRKKYQILCVIVRNDEQLMLRKDYTFMNLDDRVEILNSLIYIDYVFPSKDDGYHCVKSLDNVIKYYKGQLYKEIVFVSDADTNDLPTVFERQVCDKYNVQCVHLDGKKIESSTELVKRVCRNGNTN